MKQFLLILSSVSLDGDPGQTGITKTKSKRTGTKIKACER